MSECSGFFLLFCLRFAYSLVLFFFFLRVRVPAAFLGALLHVFFVLDN